MKSLIITLLIFVLFGSHSIAQIDIFKRKAQEKLENKIEEAFDEKEEEEDLPAEDEESEETETPKQSKPEEVTLQSYSNYDFLPGENQIFFDDFSQDNIGDFPDLWFTNGSGEVVKTNLFDGKWFKMRQDALFYFENIINFPENFTIEFDVIPINSGDYQSDPGFDLTILEVEEGDNYPTMYVPGKRGVAFYLSATSESTFSTYEDAEYKIQGKYTKEQGKLKPNVPNRVSIWIQKQRVRLYMHGEKVFDIPKGLSKDCKLNQIRFLLSDGSEPMISNFRIAEASADMRQKLMTEGKIVSYGIYFDTGKDIVKPESYPSLKHIADIIKSDGKINVQVVGHTDSDGNAASNLDLSKRRAASVKNSLVKEFKIDADKISTDGKGDAEPVAGNSNASDKAKNRRVEFILK